jgi:hypothetical protein
MASKPEARLIRTARAFRVVGRPLPPANLYAARVHFAHSAGVVEAEGVQAVQDEVAVAGGLRGTRGPARTGRCFEK